MKRWPDWLHICKVPAVLFFVSTFLFRHRCIVSVWHLKKKCYPVDIFSHLKIKFQIQVQPPKFLQRTAPLRPFGNLFCDNESAQLKLASASGLLLFDVAETSLFSCLAQSLTSEMLVHFTFDSITASIMEKDGSLATCGWLSFMYCSYL